MRRELVAVGIDVITLELGKSQVWACFVDTDTQDW